MDSLRPSSRAVRAGMAGGLGHLVLLLAVAVALGDVQGSLTDPEYTATVAVLLVLVLLSGGVSLGVGPDEPSLSHLAGGLVAVLGVVLLGLAVVTLGETVPPANARTETVGTYLLGVAMLLYVYGGAVVVGAVPVVLWVDRRAWLPAVVTGVAFLAAVTHHWVTVRQAQALPPVTGLVAYALLWFLVPLLAVVVAVLELGGRRVASGPNT